MKVSVHPNSILTPRQTEIVGWVALGKSNYDISRILNTSENTISNHLTSAFKRLDCVNRAHAVSKAIFKGIISINTVIMMIALGSHPADLDMKRDARRYKRRRMVHSAILNHKVGNSYYIPDRIG